MLLLSTWMVSGQIAGASSPGYPPMVTNPPSPCTNVVGIPPVPAAQFSTIENKVRSFVSKAKGGVGMCEHGLMIVMLPVGSESLAQKVRAKFGPSVQIMVGFTNWDGHPGKSPFCGTLARPAATPAPYSTTLTLRSTRIKVGQNFTGNVAFHNTSEMSLSYLTIDTVEAVVIRPGTRRAVGIFTGQFALPGLVINIGPGQTKNIFAIGGTGRCDGGYGSALPPGHYDAVAQVSGTEPTGVDSTGPIHFTQVVPIRIMPR
jgi:hypothetical protein